MLRDKRNANGKYCVEPQDYGSISICFKDDDAVLRCGGEDGGFLQVKEEKNNGLGVFVLPAVCLNVSR